jgi:hypothetical protein
MAADAPEGAAAGRISHSLPKTSDVKGERVAGRGTLRSAAVCKALRVVSDTSDVGPELDRGASEDLLGRLWDAK